MIKTYSRNLLAYLIMHDIPIDYKKDDTGKIFGVIDDKYAEQYEDIKSKYIKDKDIRVFLDCFKEVKLNIAANRDMASK